MLRNVFQAIQRIEAWILAAAILSIAALTIVNVIVRSTSGDSLAATEELCQFLIVLVTFVGLSYGASMGRHIRMTALYDQLGRRARRITMIAITGSTALLLLYLAWLALDYALVVRRLGSVSPVLQVPLYLIYLIAPAGLTMAALQYGLAARKNLVEEEVYLSFDVKDEYIEANGDDKADAQC